MKELNNLGEFRHNNAVWEKYPEGGKEGDFLTIAGEKYYWNKYKGIWDNTDISKQSGARKTDSFDGDVHVQHTLDIGGMIHSRGSVRIDRSLQVGGTIMAEGVSSKCLGIFETADDLQEQHPEPEVGMYAGVGFDFDQSKRMPLLYVCKEEGVWHNTGKTFTNEATVAFEMEMQAVFETNEQGRQATFETNEADRQATFETNEAARTSTFDKNEAERQQTFDENEEDRQATFEGNEGDRQATSYRNESERQRIFAENETNRVNTFETNEAQRKETFVTNETERQADFVADEAQRKQTFETNETERQNTFDGNEEEHQQTFETNEDDRQQTFETNEAARTSTFNHNEAERQAAFVADEAVRENTFKANEKRRKEEFEYNEGQRQVNETARQVNEQAREAAEELREQTFENHENFRDNLFSKNEIRRELKEKDRVAAEAEREAKEQERQAKEQERIEHDAALEGRLTDNEEKLSELESKTEEITKEFIETEDDSISIEDDNGNKVFYLDENGLDAKNVKSNGKDVLTEHQDISGLATKEEVAEKQDLITPISQEETSDDADEQIFASDDYDEDDGTGETYAKITREGILAKGYYDIYGNSIFSSIQTSDDADEQIFASDDYDEDDGTGEIYAKITRDGISAKGYYDIYGNSIFSSIPQYYNVAINEFLSKLQIISKDGNTSSYAFMTDLHWSTKGSGYLEERTRGPIINIFKALKDIDSKFCLSGIFTGGDYIQAPGTEKYPNTKQYGIDNIMELNSWLSKMNAPTFALRGNHEKTYNGGSLTQYNYGLTDNEVYAYLEKKYIKHDVKQQSKGYYYINDDLGGIFVLLISTFKEIDYNNSTILSTLSKNVNNYPVIVFNHFAGHLVGDRDDYASDEEYLAAYYVYDGVKSAIDAIKNGGYETIAWIGGHNHSDFSKIYNNTLVISCMQSCVMNSGISEDGVVYTHTFNSITESALSVITIDKTKGKLYCTRLGAGVDREFNYNSISGNIGKI